MKSNTRSDQSFGIIPIYYKNKKPQVFVLQHLNSNHWGFPKGHPENGEDPLSTAKRELFEETGLVVKKLLLEEILRENYVFSHKGEIINKKVDYFVAEVELNGPIVLDKLEVVDGKWVDVNEGPLHLTYEEGKKLCRIVAQLL